MNTPSTTRTASAVHKRSPSQAPLLRRPASSRSPRSALLRPAVLLPLAAVFIVALTFLPMSRLLPSPRRGSDGPQVPFPPLPSTDTDRVRIGTWNLRFDGLRGQTVPVGQPGDGSERPKHELDGDGFGERPWAERRWRVLDTILQQRYDIIGFQEAFKSQVDDLQALLGEGWRWVGVGRDDGFQQGEYAPIFYNSDLFEHVSHEYVWLSPTPEVPGSKGWDASQPRIATLLTLNFKASGELLHVGNTHWDDQGVRAREHSGRMLREILPAVARKVEQKYAYGDGETLFGGVVLIGDLNSPAEERGYQSLVNSTALAPALPGPEFHDTLYLLSLRPSSASPPLSRTQQRTPHLPFGPWNTYTGFVRNTRMTRIDFVFLYDESFASASPSAPSTVATLLGGLVGGGGKRDEQRATAAAAKSGWVVGEYAVVDNWVDGDWTGWRGRVSDHRAVVVELVKV